MISTSDVVRIVDRTEKLIHLSASSVEPEARSAAYAACALIRKHNLRVVSIGGFAYTPPPMQAAWTPPPPAAPRPPSPPPSGPPPHPASVPPRPASSPPKTQGSKQTNTPRIPTSGPASAPRPPSPKTQGSQQSHPPAEPFSRPRPPEPKSEHSQQAHSPSDETNRPRVIHARYSDCCASCSAQWSAGERIFWQKNVGVTCVDCREWFVCSAR